MIRSTFAKIFFKMLIPVLLLIVGFVLLIKGAEWLVNGSVSLARRFNISELAIGLTIVAFGTSAPELVVNILSSVNGYNDVVMGNIVGSNLFNILLILGVSAIIYPVSIQLKTIKKEIPFSLFAAILLLAVINDTTFFNTDQNLISRIDGFILLVFFILFIWYISKNLKNLPTHESEPAKEYKLAITILLVLAGLGGLILGGNMVVDNAVKIAKALGLSERIIGLTIISAGTSLPELATSAVAALKKRSDLAIGNIIGSNIFNIFLVLGLSAVISPVIIIESFNIDIFLLIASTLLLLFAMLTGKKYILDRWEGALFSILFVGYIIWLIY
jgi:cation:H+ antiporter